MSPCECFKSGDDVEKFVVDAALAEAMESAVEIFHELFDVSLGTLHGGETIGVFASERFGAGTKKGDK